MSKEVVDVEYVIEDSKWGAWIGDNSLIHYGLTLGLSYFRAWLLATRFYPWFVLSVFPTWPKFTPLMVWGFLLVYEFATFTVPTKKSRASETYSTADQLGHYAVTLLFLWAVLWLLHHFFW